MPPDDLPDDLQRPLEESAPATEPPPADPPPGDLPPTDPPPGDLPPTDLPPPAAVAPADDPVPAGTPALGGSLRPAVPVEPDVRSHRRRWTPRVGMLVRAGGASGRVLRRGGRAVAGWYQRPSGRFAVPATVIVVLVGAAVATGGFLVPSVGAAGDPTPEAADPPRVAPTAPVVTRAPDAIPVPTARPGATATPGARAEALAGWAEQMSASTGIPEVALQAYGYAELAVARDLPQCRLRWTTLAAIGRVESNHGRTGSATLRDDGRAVPMIFGPPLDGTGDTRRLLDTDGGDLDADTTYDRAVGPMQFIPQTWRREAVDATGDGVADIHNIHDAALAAANYLCDGGRDLSTADGWRSAVLAYNNVQSYAEEVFVTADEYGRLSRA